VYDDGRGEGHFCFSREPVFEEEGLSLSLGITRELALSPPITPRTGFSGILSPGIGLPSGYAWTDGS